MKLVISQLDRKSRYLKAYAYDGEVYLGSMEYSDSTIRTKGCIPPALYYLFLELVKDYFGESP